jgi:phosphoenolpyruvate-protein kinase (PTS system EI component)
VRLEAELRGHDALLAEEVRLPAVTLDGAAIHLAANLGKSADAEAALHWHADSVGLYRTEFAFGIRDSFPTEDEQTAILTDVAERLHPRPIVFRLLDLGAEKCLPYFPLPSAANPALGLRGTRLLLAHPEVLRTQLRAILRVSAGHPVSVLLPMVGGVEEVQAVRRVLAEETRQLVAAGLAVAASLPLGAMVEIPSAVLVARELARETDFLSLGSNDLAQYLLAADRDDPAMSGYYRMLHPAVLRAIRSVVRAAEHARKELTICGEAAGDPSYTELFLGLGVRRFSASPQQLGELRHEVRQYHCGRARSLAQRLLRCATRDEVRRALDRRAARLAAQAGAGGEPVKGSSVRRR